MTSWRERLAVVFGPGLLTGVTFRNWRWMLQENRYAIPAKYWLRASVITHCSLLNSFVAKQEQRQFSAEVEKQVIPPPLFILGHWRSGTTHLHNLLSQDDRFAFPNVFEALYPHSFLSTECSRHYKLLRTLMPRRRPMDDMRLDLTVPWEDEYAVCIDSGTSSYMGPVFPKRLDHYDRYMTFRDASDEEVARWKSSLLKFLKKLTYKYRRPLILKSPPHTCRIRLLLEMFPDAKFVHIHRNPIDVFQSTQQQTRVMLRWYELQRFPTGHLDDWIVRRYREMYEVFFEERSSILGGNYHEVSFEELELDPIATMQAVYDGLHLPDFNHVKPQLRSYLASLGGYHKNVFAALPDGARARIAANWQRSFAEWGYSTGG